MNPPSPIETRALAPGRPTSWDEVRRRLEHPEPDRTCWLSTVRPDGSPHLMRVIGLWIDDGFCFISGDGTRKGRNLTHDARCAVGVGSTTVPSLDIILEGVVHRVVDAAELRRVTDAYRSVLDWPLELRDGVVVGPNAPTVGPAPYAVLKLVPRTVFGLPGVAGMDQGTAVPTRWRFSSMP